MTESVGVSEGLHNSVFFSVKARKEAQVFMDVMSLNPRALLSLTLKYGTTYSVAQLSFVFHFPIIHRWTLSLWNEIDCISLSRGLLVFAPSL